MESNRLKAVREKHGYKQPKIAEVIGVSVPTYSLMESGKREINSEKLRKLSSFYRCSIDELLGTEYYYISLEDENGQHR